MDSQVRAGLHAEYSVEISKRQMMMAFLEGIGENPCMIQAEAWRIRKEAVYGPYIIIVSKTAVYLVPSLNIRAAPKGRFGDTL